ncbi:hypothetical protein BKA01_006984 [Pseudonocardia eucalypti]|uniref:DUF6401 family natural product biosynthesis protein n=1 Tax=Pseudonocardia eucalypti TaxID=648755 RepID=UPI00160CCBAF|nr:hypothetical protein [Pseudonocardia eucalypti]
MSAGPEVFTHFSARRWLNRLHHEVGAAGLTAAAAVPGLSAVLDQHAAAVRDATTLGLEAAAVAGVVLLASYGHAVLTHAREHGWQPPHPHPSRWRAADWTSLRLTAVCALARTPNTSPALPRLNP